MDDTFGMLSDNEKTYFSSITNYAISPVDNQAFLRI
jgi:hypothetical protein